MDTSITNEAEEIDAARQAASEPTGAPASDDGEQDASVPSTINVSNLASSNFFVCRISPLEVPIGPPVSDSICKSYNGSGASIFAHSRTEIVHRLNT